MKAAAKGETTQRNDFTWPEIEKSKPDSWEQKRKEKPLHKIRPAPEYKRFDTHMEVISENWPHFNFYHRPKPIIATDPKEPFETKVLEPSKEEDELVRKTRPRVVIAPALSLDDAAEVLGKNELDLLLAYTYTTTWGKDSKEAALCIPKKPTLNTTYETNADPVRFRPDETLAVECPSGRELQVEVSTGKFEKSPLPSSEQIVTEEQTDTTTKHGDLRIAHDLPKSGYSGYMPRHVANIPLWKTSFPVTDVRVSVNQAVTMRTGSQDIC